MSNRISCIILALFVTVFLNVHDRPVVSNLDDYMRLVTRGMVIVDICGEDTQLFWQDFSPEDREILQLMLRTP